MVWLESDDGRAGRSRLQVKFICKWRGGERARLVLAGKSPTVGTVNVAQVELLSLKRFNQN